LLTYGTIYKYFELVKYNNDEVSFFTISFLKKVAFANARSTCHDLMNVENLSKNIIAIAWTNTLKLYE